MDLSEPQVMGILNVTPDSFYSGSRKQTDEEVASRVEQIRAEGGSIVDIGAYSSRPNADDVPEKEEMERLRKGLATLRRLWPDAVVSVDTFRSSVAKMCVEEYGAAIVNDISGGELDKAMFGTVAKLGVPYILMHMKGTPQDMQVAPAYDNVTSEVLLYLQERVQRLRDLGQKDIILDPGFGFAKTLEHNYELLCNMDKLKVLGLPVLAGISRKSMIYKLVGGDPHGALNGTTALNVICMLKGASILRVHDVRQCVEAVEIVKATLKYA